jgi:biotin synthase-related radical SAM superfamily protein
MWKELKMAGSIVRDCAVIAQSITKSNLSVLSDKVAEKSNVLSDNLESLSKRVNAKRLEIQQKNAKDDVINPE